MLRCFRIIFYFVKVTKIVKVTNTIKPVDQNVIVIAGDIIQSI